MDILNNSTIGSTTQWTPGISDNNIIIVNNERSGDGEKVLAMAVLGLGSFVFGMLPACISENNRRRFPLTTSLLLCFGAGILLATALVHILPEVREQMATNFAEIAFCVGFFVIYFIDELIHFCFGETVRHAHSHSNDTPTATANANVTGSNITTTISTTNQTTNRSYGAIINNEASPLLRTDNGNGMRHEQHSPASSSTVTVNVEPNKHTNPDSTITTTTEIGALETLASGHGHSHSHATPCDDDAIVEAANATFCHTNHSEPCVTQSMTGTLGLFAALSLHSAIEGLAIGVQNSATKVLFLLGAVACHKFVMAFCLGLEFRSNTQTRLRSQVIGISVFALGAISGIGIGMIIVDIPSGWVATALPVIQALAGGTLLYVTVCEVMPREKARWHQNTAHKAAGFLQFFAAACGFTIMCIMNYYLDDDSKSP